MNAAPTATFPNKTGDVTIGWDDLDEDVVLAIIEKKMKEGYTFFVLKKPLFPFFKPKKVAMQSIDEARTAGKVVVPDAMVQKIVADLGDPDLNAAYSNGKVQVVSRTRPAHAESKGRAATAAEVVKTQTIAIQPLVGG